MTDTIIDGIHLLEFDFLSFLIFSMSLSKFFSTSSISLSIFVFNSFPSFFTSFSIFFVLEPSIDPAINNTINNTHGNNFIVISTKRIDVEFNRTDNMTLCICGECLNFDCIIKLRIKICTKPNTFIITDVQCA